MAMELSKADDGSGKHTITIVGEIDLYTSPKLRSAITESVPAASRALHVSLASVEYMDSSGVATLVEGLRAAMERNLEFVLLSPSPSVLKVLQLSRLDTVFTIREHA
ncbi:MAG TPA: STAS domain-containing protein [Candidatus Hydrogenedentes bacterium]|nr:STAS domain-containing protein [Candidatus Hydrogenedentota bacterium]